MLITGIRQTSPGRLTVGLDDGSEVKTTLGVVTDMRLYAGRELDGEAVNAIRISLGSIQDRSRLQAGLQRLSELLARRPESFNTAVV